MRQAHWPCNPVQGSQGERAKRPAIPARHRAADVAPIVRLLNGLAAIARPEKRIDQCRRPPPAPACTRACARAPAQARRDHNATAGSASSLRPRRRLANRVGDTAKASNASCKLAWKTFALFDAQPNALNFAQSASHWLTHPTGAAAGERLRSATAHTPENAHLSHFGSRTKRASQSAGDTSGTLISRKSSPECQSRPAAAT
jgi:hypothetical protein